MPEAKTRKPRSVVNALKIVNSLRTEKGLGKALLKPKTITVSPAEKNEIAREEAAKLFPDLFSSDFIWTDKNEALLNKAVEERVVRIKSGKEEKPVLVVASAPQNKPASLGRKPRK